MADDDDPRGLAGEYVLGTLSPAERLEAQNRLSSDGEFRDAVAFWEGQLGMLGAAAAPREPPAALKTRILDRIATTAGAGDNVVALKRKLTVWRALGIGASAIAAGLAALLFTQMSAPQPGQTYVAVLQSGGPDPAFVASIDLAQGTVSVRRLTAPPEPGKSFELWAVGGGREKPESLGVIDASLKMPAQRLGRFDPDTIFAISLEPEGGSPTGQATGPVLYTGKLVATE